MLAHSPSHVHLALRFAPAILWSIGVVPSAEVRAESVRTLTFIEVRADARGHAGNVLRQQAKSLREHISWPAQIVLLQELSLSVR
jgi:hypothetical protein